MTKVFIDGSAGTTGLDIFTRLSAREDVELIVLPEELRKDEASRRDALEAADIAFLCLPDAAAREAAGFLADQDTVLIDTSTAHRVDPAWTYGFPEAPSAREQIASSKRIANPGCHAIGFIALVQPLVAAGLIEPFAVLAAFSLTGFSGGGKSMIAAYEDPSRDPLLDAPRLYALGQEHKHLPEMQAVCGLEAAPLFSPVVAPYYKGMQVTVMLPSNQLQGTLRDVKEVYGSLYRGPVVSFVEGGDEEGFLSAGAFAGRDDMEISVWGNGERILLVSRFDNLGKGACGSAIQNMNLVLGVDETSSLVLGRDLG